MCKGPQKSEVPETWLQINMVPDFRSPREMKAGYYERLLQSGQQLDTSSAGSLQKCCLTVFSVVYVCEDAPGVKTMALVCST